MYIYSFNVHKNISGFWLPMMIDATPSNCHELEFTLNCLKIHEHFYY